MDPLDHASRFNTFLNIQHKAGIADIQPKVINQQNLGSGTLTLAQLSTSAYTSSNVAGTLVYRDSSGNFACNVITGRTTGNESPLTFNAPLSRSVNTISLTYTPLNKAGDTMTGNLGLNAVNIATDTTTGTKIGTAGGAAGQKLGFFNAAPIVQPLLATGAGHTVDDIISTLQSLGIVRQS